jgi:hypothetical protein
LQYYLAGFAEKRLEELNALLHTLKASLLRHGKASCPQLSQAIEERLSDGKAMEKILLSGHDVHPSTYAVLVDVLAEYPHIKNVSLWGVPIGDVGLKCMTQTLVAGAGSWYKGSRLLSLEMVALSHTRQACRCVVITHLTEYHPVTRFVEILRFATYL